MSLRSKFLLIIIGFLLLQASIFFAYYSMVLMPNVENLEYQQAQKNAERSRHMLNFDMEDIDELAQQWAQQEMLIHFLRKEQTPQIEVVFSEQRIREEKLHLFYLVDKNMNVLTNVSLDPQTLKPYPVLNFMNKISKLVPSYFKSNAIHTNLSGVFLSERGPMLLTAKPVLDKNNALLGWLIMGRYITQSLLDRFSQQMRTELKLFPLGVKNLPDKIAHLIPVIQANPNLVHIESTSTTLKAYTHLTDVSGIPSVVLLSITPRNTSILIRESMRQSYAVLLSANFILVLLLMKILHHAIVRPTGRLNRFIKEVISHIDAPPRIKTSREDEIGKLTKNLNEMIVHFCEHKNETMSKAYQNGANRAKLEMVEDLSYAMETIIPLVENLEKRLWALSLNDLEKLQAEVECSKEASLKKEDLLKSLDANNYYFRNEVDDHRSQIKKIKQKLLRTATIVKSYSIHLNQSRTFTSSNFEGLNKKTKTSNDF